MVGWCGKQFCDQVLLCRPLCCQQTLHYTTKSVQLKALQNFIYSSGPICLHSNQNQDHFLNPLIKGFQDVKLKISHYLKFLAFIAGLSDSLLSRGLLEMVKLSFAHFKREYLFILNFPHFTMIKLTLEFSFQHTITLSISPKKVN